ncbi:helix-turn-helix transcriptional regulator [Tomitella fengzijianii]|uniref:helix-turn-helix transcriptional regulator n=1 Tax=Tomitella fengzijianii TaxID=2597660 RepID=UPI00131A991A|nr:helix-turn-helix domain-containing protein [Tomitella fengzijianii]
MTQRLTTAQAEEYIGVPAATLRFWRHKGEGPASYTLGGRRVVYDREDLDAWIDAQKKATVRGGIA